MMGNESTVSAGSASAKARERAFSRRAFLGGAGLAGAATLSLGGAAAAMGSELDGSTASAGGADVVTRELPVKDMPAPETTSYTCDVLVIGGGWAGQHAAMTAAAAGASTVLVDKGRPGFSGLSPWPSSHRWFDADLGDDADAFRKSIQKGSDYTSNAAWYQVWIDRSKQAYEENVAWGLLDRYDRCADTEYWDTLDFQGYYQSNLDKDRHRRVCPMLEEAGVTVVDYTMITDVVREEGRVVGAAGFHVPSGAIMSFNAKAVVMAMGGGCYKPSGYPVGGDTFDGEYIAYNLGLPIANKEYDDFHASLSYAPGDAFELNSWDFLENIWLCGGDITQDNWESYAKSKQKVMVFGRVTGTIDGVAANSGTGIDDQKNGTIERRGGSAYAETNPADPRTGKEMSPKPKGDVYGAAVGMQAHFTGGVFCGLDDLEGYTGIPGLWVAGDGMNGCAVTGSAYPVGVGFTSNFCSIQGDIAGEAAAAYAQGAAEARIPDEELAAIAEQIQAPLAVEKGFSPDWARDQLQAIMSPWWVLIAKSEANLSAALTQVVALRDNVVPKLMASNSHQLRLAIEMRHKVLSAEMKLRASLERKESRGVHYRSDYPYRDDANFLCYITCTKGEDGSMQMGKVDIPAEWVGDTSEDYATRYVNYFPGEREAMGLPEEEQSSGGWSK